MRLEEAAEAMLGCLLPGRRLTQCSHKEELVEPVGGEGTPSGREVQGLARLRRPSAQAKLGAPWPQHTHTPWFTLPLQPQHHLAKGDALEGQVRPLQVPASAEGDTQLRREEQLPSRRPGRRAELRTN